MTGAISPSTEPVEPRSQRSEITLVCETRQGARPWNRVHLHNISETGFQMDWVPGLDMEKPLYIRIPGLQTLSADLKWRREGRIGCAFSAPLYAPVYDHIVARARAAC